MIVLVGDVVGVNYWGFIGILKWGVRLVLGL